MSAKIFSKEEWPKVVESLQSAYRVMAPVRVDGHVEFKYLKDGDSPDFTARKSKLSVKHAVFPQSERMFTYSVDPADPDAGVLKEAEKDFGPQAVVGLRPCDAKAFKLTEVNFDNDDYKDPWWTKRYAATTLIGFGCNEPGRSCFCTSVGSGPFDKSALDVLVYDLGDDYVAKGLTEKGEKALGVMGGKDAEEGSLEAAQSLKPKAEAKMSATVKTDKLKDKKATDLFEADFWQDLAAGCLNCGACTYSCPTCWCFDIQDEVQRKAKTGDRIRNWDSCMYSLFTLHGSGHNPRNLKHERTRNRFMHKVKYYLDKYDQGIMCVGCGRCIENCPVNIDIRQVIDLMNNH